MNNQVMSVVNGTHDISRLVLPSIEISNFRTFRHLRIERFGRVNLIVGKNNVGKSCLLEAVRLYMESGSARCLLQLLEGRDELFRVRSNRTFGRPIENAESEQHMLSSVGNLFHGRKNHDSNLPPITLGPVDQPAAKVTIKATWFIQGLNEDGSQRLKRIENAQTGQQTLFGELQESLDTVIPGLTVQVGNALEQPLLLRRLFDRPNMTHSLYPAKPPIVFVPAHGLNLTQISQMWDDITLTRLEQDVLQAVQIITPEAEGLNIVGDPVRSRDRIAIIKVAGFDDPIPLRSMGEGMNRIFGIALALVSAQQGVLAIDEVESGLHYSIQLEMWKVIITVAHRLNIQVFATTHSWDCIAAFQQASQEMTADDGMLIRLERKHDVISATLFDESKLSIATREQIEVR